MAVKYLSGNRLQGTAAERTALNFSSPPQTSWKELDRVTLGGAGNDLDTSTFTTKDNIMILANPIWNSGNPSPDFRFNGDSGSNYARRISEGGGSDATVTSQAEIYTDTWGGGASSGMHSFEVMNLPNISAQEKLITHHKVYNRAGVGAGSAPNRVEAVHKWANTSAQINRVQLLSSVSNAFATGSEIVVLGCDNDEADSGTNFWQQLADVELSGTGNLDSGTFTAKKYLCFQTYHSGMVSGNDLLRFNEDSGSNYSDRKSSDGGTDATRTSQSSFLNHIGEGGRTTPAFTSWYVVNVAAKEKLAIGQTNQQLTAGAGNAPTRLEVVGKWANTSDQITRINAQGNFPSGSRITVWGAD